MSPQEPAELKILSFDPGTTNMGWAMCVYKPRVGELLVHKHGILKPSRKASKVKEAIDLVDNRIITMDMVEQDVTNLLNEFDPDYVGSESAFYSPRSPNAYMVLSLCVHTVGNLLYQRWKQGVGIKRTAARLYQFPPRTIKVAISKDGTSDKIAVTEAIYRNPMIQFRIKPESLTEHEADAIACGFTLATTVLVS